MISVCSLHSCFVLSLDKEMWRGKRNLKHGSHFSGASGLVGESEFLTPMNVRTVKDLWYLNTDCDGSEDLQFKSWGFSWGLEDSRNFSQEVGPELVRCRICRNGAGGVESAPNKEHNVSEDTKGCSWDDGISLGKWRNGEWEVRFTGHRTPTEVLNFGGTVSFLTEPRKGTL